MNETIDLIIDTFFETLKDIYMTGARNFLLFTIQALNELPRFNKTNINEIKNDCIHFNDHLNKKSI